MNFLCFLPDPPETHTHDVVRALTSSPAAVLTSSNPVMMSSIDDASIRDVWKVLEQEPSSPSIASEQGKFVIIAWAHHFDISFVVLILLFSNRYHQKKFHHNCWLGSLQ